MKVGPCPSLVVPLRLSLSSDYGQFHEKEKETTSDEHALLIRFKAISADFLLLQTKGCRERLRWKRDAGQRKARPRVTRFLRFHSQARASEGTQESLTPPSGAIQPILVLSLHIVCVISWLLSTQTRFPSFSPFEQGYRHSDMVEEAKAVERLYQ